MVTCIRRNPAPVLRWDTMPARKVRAGHVSTSSHIPKTSSLDVSEIGSERLEAVSYRQTVDKVGFRLANEVDPHRRRQRDLSYVEHVVRTRHDHKMP